MKNWANSVELGPKSKVHRPRNEQELIELFKVNSLSCIKVLGSGMSYLPIGAITNIENSLLLDLSIYKGLTEINGNEATFGAQTTLKFITDILLENDLQLTTSPGVLLTQTLAGALATGTHGQGYRNGGFADIITKVRVILASGEIKEYTESDQEFDSFRIHLGVLGLITHVTLKCEPAKVYRLVKGITDFQDMLENYEKWNQTNFACKAWWFPKTDHVQLWKTFEADEEQTAEYKKRNCEMYEIVYDEDGKEKEDFTESLSEMVHQLQIDTVGKPDDDIASAEDTAWDSGDDSSAAEPVKESIFDDANSLKSISTDADSNIELKGSDYVDINAPNARFRTVLRFKSQSDCIGNLYQLWCKGIPAPQVNCEIAVPMNRYKEAITKLRNYYRTSGKEVHYPFILRATGQSRAALGPSYNGPVCYIGFLVYLAENDYSANEERLEFLKEIEGLLSDFDSIPHYGKFYTRSRYNLKERLPKFKEFLQVRERLDPHGLFLNEHLQDLLQ
jgi:FAD/FMN-containing dehydrogenase